MGSFPFLSISSWVIGILHSCGNQQFVLKDVLGGIQFCLDMQQALSLSRDLRLIQDTIPERPMFVYAYLKDHLLSLAQEDLPFPLTKRILNDALRGLAELHHQDIVHTGQIELALRLSLEGSR